MARLALKKEPEDLLFLNTMPSKLKCHADGYPKPQISWLDEKGSTVQPINGIRYVSGGDLHFNAFEANQYMASAHRTKYRCNISSEVGAIVSKEIRVRAGKRNLIQTLSKLVAPSYQKLFLCFCFSN